MMVLENKFLPTILVLMVFLVASGSFSTAESGPYSGLTVGSLDYREKGSISGSDYDQTWSHTSFEGRLGYAATSYLGFDVRYGFSGTTEEELLGVPVKTKVDQYSGGFGKLKIPLYSIRPYVLAGYTSGEILACATSCGKVEWSGASGGIGIEINLAGNSTNSFYVEGIKYSDKEVNGTTEEITGVNIGLTFSSN
ncbi:MAG: outer membrane beta-barrel protein [bacterium]